MKEIENLKPKDENEKKELMERVSFEKFSILEPLIPKELYVKYRDYRFKEFVEEDEISKKSSNSEKSAHKRKNVGEKSNKKRKNKKDNAERSKNQIDIGDYFLKKK